MVQLENSAANRLARPYIHTDRRTGGWTDTHTHSHTHTSLTALFPGLPGWAGTRKVKPIWILLKQDSGWQWHQLGHMQVCTSLQTNNHTSTPPLSFLQAGCPSCRPTNSVKALKATKMNWHQRIMLIITNVALLWSSATIHVRLIETNILTHKQ